MKGCPEEAQARVYSRDAPAGWRIGFARTVGVEVVRSIGVTQFTYCRWRKEFGGLKANQVKELEKENERLRKVASDLALEKLILRDAAS